MIERLIGYRLATVGLKTASPPETAKAATSSGCGLYV
jgi:hypothetical protein